MNCGLCSRNYSIRILTYFNNKWFWIEQIEEMVLGDLPSRFRPDRNEKKWGPRRFKRIRNGRLKESTATPPTQNRHIFLFQTAKSRFVDLQSSIAPTPARVWQKSYW